jgi:hypothetical protein
MTPRTTESKIFALIPTVAALPLASGGRFLAYASVADNRSGDPIYIPAR